LEDGRGLVPGVEDEGVVEEREGGAVEGRRETLSAFCSTLRLSTEVRDVDAMPACARMGPILQGIVQAKFWL
jgi:hypothetical protein